MDITSLVRAVIAAFEDAAKLVQRIRDQRIDQRDTLLPDEPMRDLLESLALGPVIVRGHYEHDLKRFGEPYACGDIQAREQMKDVLINLQMSLIITLRTVYMDSIEMDFLMLQTASDDCRVNAGVCLGQLAQRLSDAVKAQAFYPQPVSHSSGSGMLPQLSPSLGYSSSRSTHSSSTFPAPRTPDPVAEQFGQLNISPPVRPPHADRKTSTSSGGSGEQYLRPQSAAIQRPAAEYHIVAPPVGVHRIDETDAVSMRRRSSQALAPEDNILLMFPQPGAPVTGQAIVSSPPSIRETDRESYVSSGKNSQVQSPPDLSRASSGHKSQNSRDRFGPDDYADNSSKADTREYSYGTIYDMYQPSSPESHASTSYSQRAQAVMGPMSADYVRFLQENSRPPRPQPRSDSLNSTSKRPTRDIPRRPLRANTDVVIPSKDYRVRPPISGPIVVEDELRTPPSGPLPRIPPSPVHPIQPQPHITTNTAAAAATSTVASKHLSPLSLHVSDRDPSIRTVASSAPSVVGPLTNTGPITLPTDKNLLGFCKGAFRLQAGLERKAFGLANRPAGFASMNSYWRCEKCNFEGPVHTSVNISDEKKKRGKSERVFDPKIRTSENGGIRYRWAFLARCHITLKGMVPSDTQVAREGAFGSFGCIFCCAEGKNRGWLDSIAGSIQGGGSSASIKSGHTANSGAKVGGAQQATPIFGNVSSFMLHLEHVHRGQDGWPNAEMVGRFRVVVGRLAPVQDESWELNFVPY